MLTVALEQLEVLKSIVLLVAVPVVDNFVWLKNSSEMLFHHKAMLENVVRVFPSPGMIFHMDQDIPVLVDQPTFPRIMPLSSLGGREFASHSVLS
jgi:hypothetical protein